MEIIHHGAVTGVTGSCHELIVDDQSSVLVDCGMFQGEETPQKLTEEPLALGFPIDRVKALFVTHCHIDHIGRIPNLIGSGFKGPIYCSEPTAILLPLILEDALKMGVTRNKALIAQFLAFIEQHLIPVPYDNWCPVPLDDSPTSVQIRFRQAGHILGSAYIECNVKQLERSIKVLFSGDLGAPYTPLLSAPKPASSADILVLESTYGDRLHQGRKERRKELKRLVERAFKDRGVVLIPAFSIGRTQELLYELEDIIYHFGQTQIAKNLEWDGVNIILDSPLAARFTKAYKRLKPFWDQEARSKTASGRHPLSFEQLTTVEDHEDHVRLVASLKKNALPAIVIAGSGMCTGGRIVSYLKALLGDPRTDVLFVGYQAKGTPGAEIQTAGSKGGYTWLDNQKIEVKAKISTIYGYSAHADQKDLVKFVSQMKKKPAEIRLVHGDIKAKQCLKEKLEVVTPDSKVIISR